MESRRGAQAFEEIRITVHDGLEIYGRRYPAPGSERRPLVCLPGLTRNSSDFDELASALSGTGEGRRTVYTLDLRGRGRSGYSNDWRQYIVPIEMLDVQDFMASQGLEGAAVLGTSRGGLVAMVLAAAQPSLIGAVILNDVGPRIEHGGLMRLQSFISKARAPLTWEDAATRLADGEGRYFPELGAADWMRLAQQRFLEKDGKPALAYDPALARTFDALDDRPLPELWPQFMALKHIPCLVIHGALSDLLSDATVTEMSQRHPNCKTVRVPQQGHAPLLTDKPTEDAIRGFLRAHDAQADPV